ncbi:MAG: FlgD immunoglobulin-like domain containing protein, partial [Candidatus Hydrothermales bacterium]
EWTSSTDQERGFKSYGFARRVPGWVWAGIFTAGSAADAIWPAIFVSPLVGTVFYRYNTTAVGNVNCNTSLIDLWAGFPYLMYGVIRHWHPTLTYYAPPGWTWPITPNHVAAGRDTVIDSLRGKDDAINPSVNTSVSFCFMNKSNVSIPTPPNKYLRGPMDIYLLFDNLYGFHFTFNSSLSPWSYVKSKNNILPIPGGRHTLTLYLDMDPNGYELMGNIFNVFYRYWGMQFSFKAPRISPKKPVLAEFVPWPVTDFSEYYYNVTVFRFKTVGVAGGWAQNPPNPKRWQGIATIASRFNVAGDSIDVDLRLYADSPTTFYDGYINVLEASEVDGRRTDFIIINGRRVSTFYYAGIYSFGDTPDSAIVDFQGSRALITLSSTSSNPRTEIFANSKIDKNARELFHIYDIVLTSGVNHQITVTPLTGLDVAVAIYGSVGLYGNDFFLRRTDALASVDAGGAGAAEVLNYNPPVTDTYALVIINKNVVNQSYTLNAYDGSRYAGFTVLAELEGNLTAESVKEGIKIVWNYDGEIIEGELLKKVLTGGSESVKEYTVIHRFDENKGSFIDKDVTPFAEYEYIVKFNTGEKVLTFGPIKAKWEYTLNEFSILKFGPNLFKEKISFVITVPEHSDVELTVYNSAGRKIKRIFSGKLNPGYYEFEWKGETDSGKKVEKGIYFLVARNKGKVIKKKIINI